MSESIICWTNQVFIKADEQRFQVRDNTFINYTSNAMDLSAACALGNAHMDDEDSTDDDSIIEDPLQNFYTRKRRRGWDDVREPNTKRRGRRLNLRMKRCADDPDHIEGGSERCGDPITGKNFNENLDLTFFGESLVNLNQIHINMQIEKCRDLH